MPFTYAYKFLANSLVTLIGFGGCLLGIALALGGESRFQSASFLVARLLPGQVYAWALIFAVAGALTLFGAWRKHKPLMRVGLFAQGFGFLTFDVGLIGSIPADPHTPVTGCVVYALVTAICFVTWGAFKELPT